MTSSDEMTNVAYAPLVLIVMLNWNSVEETRTALDSVLRMSYPNFRVLIVDNGSKDGSNVALRELAGDRVELLESPTNTGYTGGCNFGLRRALEIGAEYAWLLNNDAVTGPNTLSSLVALAESDEKIGLVTPRIAALDEDRLTFAGGVVSPKRRLYNETNDPAVAAQWEKEFPDAGLVIGTAMLVRAEVIRRIGVLDTAFFAYFEDIDYSARSTRAGFRNVVDEKALVRHFEKNRNTRPLEIKPHYWYYMARNESRFWRKHLGLPGGWKLMWHSCNGFLRHRNRLREKPESQRAILAGLWHGWLNRGGEYDPAARMPALVAALVEWYSQREALQPR
ncbi:MAG: glycosyltransferase family 2 protein [Acidobacteria bacterium]|nr:glycosyltransferase family 2 protein [Acidobacteriota bacterium]